MSTGAALLILQRWHGHPITQAKNTHRMSTGIALLILHNLHGHPIRGYENPQNE